MKRIGQVFLVVMFICISLSGAYADEIKKSGYASVDLMSNYIWRGQKLSNSWVLQPSVGINYGSFGASIWSNYDSDRTEAASGGLSSRGKITETDITLTYTHSIDKLTLAGGYIYYALEGANDTQEIFITASYNTILNPSLTVYYDYDEGNGAFIVLGVGHAFPILKDIGVKLGASASYNIRNKVMGFDSGGKRFSNFYNAEISASVAIPLYKDISITPKIAYSMPLSNDAKAAIKSISDDNKKNILYGGINLTLSF
jgi:hypothetical protein